MGVSFSQQPKMIGVPLGNIVRKVTGNSKTAIFKPLGHSQKGHPALRKFAKVDGTPPIGSTDCNGDMLSSCRRRLHLPLSQNTKPPDKILATI